MVCRECGKEKPAYEFYRCTQNDSLHQYACKECSYRKEKERKQIPDKKRLDVSSGFLTCSVCKRETPIERLVKQSNKESKHNSNFIARCKDCENIRKNRPDIWIKRFDVDLVLDTLKGMGKI